MHGWETWGRSWTLEFQILGIPVRVHPAFWLTALLLGLYQPHPVALLAWVLAMFLAVLVHELGHALMMKLYSYRPEILLYGLGGVTEYGSPMYGPAVSTPSMRILIIGAGPIAGLALGFGIAALVRFFGGSVEIVFLLQIIPMPVLRETIGSVALSLFLQFLIWIGVFWSIINLMPVYPLDGGQITRELLMLADPREGLRQSLRLSFYSAIFLAVFGYFAFSSILMLLLFGILAYNNYQLLRGIDAW